MLTAYEWEAVCRANLHPWAVAKAQGMTVEAVEAEIDAAQKRIESRAVAALPGVLMTPLLKRDDYMASSWRRLRARVRVKLPKITPK